MAKDFIQTTRRASENGNVRYALDDVHDEEMYVGDVEDDERTRGEVDK